MLPLLYRLNTKLDLSVSTLTIFEVLSSLQILQAPLMIIFRSAPSHQTMTAGLYKDASFMTGIINLYNFNITEQLLQTFWICIAIYFILHLLVMIVLVICYLFYQRLINKRLMKAVNFSYLFHSRIAFFLIQTFFCLFLQSFDKVRDSSQSSVLTQSDWFIITVILSIFNLGIAALKEFALHHFNREKEFTGIKTNLYHQVILTFKVTALILNSLSQKQAIFQANSIIHFIFSAALVYILLSKLPFYSLTILKTNIVMSALVLSCSFVSILDAFITDRSMLNGLQVFFFLFPPLMIKIMLSTLKLTLRRVVRRISKRPEHIVHLALLLELANEDEQFATVKRKSAFPDLFMLNQTLNLDAQSIKDDNNKLIEESTEMKLARYVIELLNEALAVYPRSEILLLNLAEIYFYKLHNIPKAIELIKKLKARSPSIAARTFIDQFYWDFENTHMNEYFDAEDQIELVEYFKYTEETHFIQERISKEIECHLSIWTEIKNNKVDVKKIVDLSTEVDKLFVRIESHFTKHGNDFRQSFILSILMYAVYLDKVRALPAESMKMVNRFQIIQKNAIQKNSFNVLSGTKAIVMISIDKRNVGEVLDVSGSIESIFATKREEVIGNNFGCLFANEIARIHQHHVLQYIRAPNQKLDYKVRTYGKTGDGNLFEVEAHFLLYPYSKKEISIMILFRKLSDPLPLMIVDGDGAVIDFSREIETAVNETKLNIAPTKLIQDFNSQLEMMNQAFSIVYKAGQYRRVGIASTYGEGVQSLNSRLTEGILSPKLGTTSTNLIQKNTEKLNLSLLSDGDDQQRLIKESLYSPKMPAQPSALISRNSSPKKFREEMAIDRAHSILANYTAGKMMNFELDNLNNGKAAVSANIRMSIFKLDGIPFKLVFITELKEEKAKLEGSLEDDVRPSEDYDSSETLADNFPEILERKVILSADLTNIELKPSEMATAALVAKLEKRLSKIPNSIQNVDSAKIEIQVRGGKEQAKPKKDRYGHQASTTSSIIKEARITRAIKDITKGTKIQSSLKYMFIFVYILLIFMIAIASVNFNLTNQSVRSVESGIEIINLATTRLQYAIKILQFTIILYSASLGLINYPAQVITQFQNNLIDDNNRLKGYSDQLKLAISATTETSLFNQAFEKNVYFIAPTANSMSAYGELDSFTATDILFNKYLLLSQFKSVKQLVAKDDILYTMNNTANDYLLSSQKIIDQTDVFLSKLINKNLNNLKIILGIEAVALVVLSLVLIAPIFIITRAYQRLFRAIIRIKEELITERINQILTAKNLFSQDVDTVSFYHRSIEVLESPEPKRLAKKNKNMNEFANGRRFKTKTMAQYLFKVIIIPLLLSIAFEIFFAVNLLDSISTFKTFQKINSQIVSLNSASYQADLFICVFAFYFIIPAKYNFRIYNQLPKTQLNPPLSIIKNFNDDFTSLFMTDDTIDPMIEDILKGSLCQYIHPEFTSDCLIATKQQSAGLLGVNSDYIQASTDLLASIASATSQLAAIKTIATYNAAVMSDLTVIKELYPAIVNHIVVNLNNKANDTLQRGVGFFVAIILFALAYQLFVYLYLVRELSRVDNGRRMVLKVIPYTLIEESKVLNFYLVNEYKHEIEGIRQLL